MKIAVVGATGLVGTVMLRVLEEYGLDKHEILLVASAKSVGKIIEVGGQRLRVCSIEEAMALTPDIAIFSAGGTTSKFYAPKFAQQGTFVIDNSSAWRMDDQVPLVVPEINASSINSDTKIIANPNCSTIQMVMALAPLHRLYGLRRLIISTYQSVTGTGVAALRQLEAEEQGLPVEAVYPHPIHRNLFPHGGTFNGDGYTTEEQKLVDETRKILGSPALRITATVVRVPVTGGHSEALNAEFEKDFDLKDVRAALSAFPGIEVQDDPDRAIYPMPLLSEHRNATFVGRIRRDFSNPNTLNMWVVADNLRKGAATNAIQIAQYLIDNKLVR